MSSSSASNPALILFTLSAVISLLFGLVVTAFFLRKLQRPAAYVLILCLAPGLGLAITSIIYFFWMVIFDPQYAIGRYLALEGVLLLAFILVGGIMWRQGRQGLSAANSKTRPRALQINFITVISLAGAVALLLAIIIFINQWQVAAFAHPDGNWDAWAIWNLKARFIFAGEQWKEAFDAAISWSHPDYPLLLPASIARLWVILGRTTQWVSMLINLLFTLSILGVMMAGIALSRGWKTAIFAGLFTLPILQGSLGFLQYADMPLAFFLLCANLLLFMADGQPGGPALPVPGNRRPSWIDRLFYMGGKTKEIGVRVDSNPDRSPNYSILVLAGVASGAAIWTKNEGWAFLLAFVIAELVIVWIDHEQLRPALKRWASILSGCAPFLAAVLIYKAMVNLPDNMLSGAFGGNILARLADPARYFLILKALFQQFISFGSPHLPLMPLLVIYMLVVGINIRRQERSAVATLGIRIAVVALVYFAMFLLTTSSLEWQLATSLNRLISQLMPSLVLLVFLSSFSIEDHQHLESEMVPRLDA